MAAAAVGRLSDSERAALDAHLEGCEACRNEMADLEAVAGMLAAADPAHLGARLEPPSAVAGAVFANLRVAQRARARRRLLSAVAAVAVAVVVSVVLAGGNGRPVEHVAFAAPAGVEATALLEARPWGTQVVLDAAGLARGRAHSVWLERADGSRVPAGTFTAVAGRRLRVVLAAGLPRAEVVAVGVSTADGTPVLRAELGR